MKKPLKLTRFGFLASAAALVFACNKSEPSGPAAGTSAPAEPSAPKILKLAFVTNNAGEFWKIAQAGIKKYESESKVQVDVKIPSNGQVEEQNQILENLASQGYDAVAVTAIAPAAQVAVLDKVAAKTKLITFDSDAPKSKRLLYIGTNNVEAGKALGAEIVKMLPNGGKAAVFVGTLSADNAKERLQGIEEAIKDKKIEIVDKREDGADGAKAKKNVEDIVNAHRDLSLLIGLYSYNGPQIAAVLEETGKKNKIQAAVFDEEEATLTAIQNGSVACTVVQKPFQFGYLSAKWMHELATKPEAMAAIPPSKIIDTGVEVITKTNVADFRTKLAELKK